MIRLLHSVRRKGLVKLVYDTLHSWNLMIFLPPSNRDIGGPGLQCRRSVLDWFVLEGFKSLHEQIPLYRNKGNWWLSQIATRLTWQAGKRLLLAKGREDLLKDAKRTKQLLEQCPLKLELTLLAASPFRESSPVFGEQ